MPYAYWYMLYAAYYRVRLEDQNHTPEYQSSGISGMPELPRNFRNAGVSELFHLSNIQPSPWLYTPNYM